MNKITYDFVAEPDGSVSGFIHELAIGVNAGNQIACRAELAAALKTLGQAAAYYDKPNADDILAEARSLELDIKDIQPDFNYVPHAYSVYDVKGTLIAFPDATDEDKKIPPRLWRFLLHDVLHMTQKQFEQSI